MGKRTGPVPGALGRLASRLYGAEIARRNARFDAGRGVQRIDLPVISVGNLSVGGTGKTPMVMHLLALLRREGHRPAVAMRGYTKGRPRPGATPDEADAYLRAFPGLAVIAQKDRTAGLRALLRHAVGDERPDCVVLDDGFQHRRLHRDLDIVLVDASRPPGEDRLLPAGWLRETPASLRRAGAVVVTHAELVDADRLRAVSAEIARAHGRMPLAIARHVWTGLKTGDESRLPLEHLLSVRVLGVCAIGNPEGFFAGLEAVAGRANVAGRIALPDHDPFDAQTLAMIRRTIAETGAQALVVTDKDWSKLRRLPEEAWACPVLRPELALVFDAGGEALERDVLGIVGGGRPAGPGGP